MKDTKRNINLDLLRSVAMLMIVCLHYLRYATLADESCRFSFTWFGVFFIRSLCFVAVNCYVLISAYFLSQSSKVKVSKIIGLIGQTYFYNVAIAGILMTMGLYGEKETFLYTLLPITTNQYWFINCYLVIYVMHPLLNNMVNGISSTRAAGAVIAGILLIFCIPQSIFPKTDWLLDSSAGFGIVWFVCLYIVGTLFRKYEKNILDQLSFRKCVIVYLVMSASLVVWRAGILAAGEILGHAGFFEGLANKQEAYNSVPVFISSVAFFLMFFLLKRKSYGLKMNALIVLLGQRTFGVYLIHQHPMLKSFLWKDIVKADVLVQGPKIFAYVWVVAAVFVLCVAVDQVRAAAVKKCSMYCRLEEKMQCLNQKVVEYFQ